MRPFELVGAVYLTAPAGAKAATLEELRRCVASAAASSLFRHTQLQRLGGDGGDVPADDLSAWVRGVVQDPETAERLAFAVQSAPPGAEGLRERLLAALDWVSAPARERRGAPEGGAFAFLSARAVPVPTGRTADDAEALAWALEESGRDVWFHHLIEEPWFIAGEAPIIAWLRAAGGEALAAALERETRRRASVDAMRVAVRRNRRRAGLTGRVLASEPPASEETRELARRLARRLAHGGEDS